MAQKKVETDNDDDFEIVVTEDQEDQDQEDQSSGSEGQEAGEENEAEEYSKKVQKRIDTLVRKQREAQEQYEAVMAEKQSVEEFARKALEDNKNLRSRLDSTTDTAYEAFGRSIDSEIAAAKAAYIRAHEESDPAAMADAQAKMAEMSARKAQLSGRPKRQPQQEQPQQQWTPPQRQQPAPVKVNEDTRNWAKENTWFQAPGKERMTGMAMILHQEALQSGFDVESQDYFAYIDQNMRKTFPEEFTGQGAQGAKPSQPRVAGAARSGGRKRVDSITESEAALCKRMGISEKAYLEQKRNLS